MINLSEDDRTKYDAYLPFKKTIAYYGGWIPGASAETYPKGFGWVMPKTRCDTVDRSLCSIGKRRN